MKSHLKVKVVSMSMEMTYIRRQEGKWKSRARYARQKQKHDSILYAERNFWSHHWHRHELKTEARSAHLAYGYMKGRSYSQMENVCYGPLKGYGSSEPNWEAIEAMVERFTMDETHPQTWMQVFAEWLDEAKKWYEGNPDRIKEMKVRLAEARRLAPPKLSYVRIA
jgi:hypothetical protein